SLSLNGNGILGTTNGQSLTLGNASTGDITLTGRGGANNGIIFQGYGIGALSSDITGRITAATLSANLGGTGFGYYNPGDLLVGNNSNTLSQLAIGTDNSVLSVV